MFVEAVFESSFRFTCVLFGAVVALYHVDYVFGVTVDVMSESGFAVAGMLVYKVCLSDMYLQVEQFFLHGYEHRGWVCSEIAKFGPQTRKSLRLLLRL